MKTECVYRHRPSQEPLITDAAGKSFRGRREVVLQIDCKQRVSRIIRRVRVVRLARAGTGGDRLRLDCVIFLSPRISCKENKSCHQDYRLFRTLSRPVRPYFSGDTRADSFAMESRVASACVRMRASVLHNWSLRFSNSSDSQQVTLLGRCREPVLERGVRQCDQSLCSLRKGEPLQICNAVFGTRGPRDPSTEAFPHKESEFRACSSELGLHRAFSDSENIRGFANGEAVQFAQLKCSSQRR